MNLKEESETNEMSDRNAEFSLTDNSKLLNFFQCHLWWRLKEEK
jgi:hypothetical protein